MIFSLEVRRARKGDCLLLHYGSKDKPSLAVIDGGPSSVYGPHLKPRLEEIREARSPGNPLPVDLLMISHVDDDHIRGILDLTREDIQAMDAYQPRLVKVLDFWHNSFDAIIGHKPAELTAAFTSQFGPAAAAGGGMSDAAEGQVEEKSPEEPEVVQSGLKVLASIEQGFRLRLQADKLGYPLNPEFDGELILATEESEAVDMGGGLQFTVAGPMQPELLQLHKKHTEWLRKLKDQGMSPPEALAAYVDKSVPNLSSIVVLAEVGRKRMLLTGDARGDKILEGLELVGLLEEGGTMEVDVLKVPHHGSANNLDDEFFERIIAEHYVFSGNGEHGNPERKALEMLFAARGQEPLVVHLTYPVDEIDGERKKDWQKQQSREKARKLKNPSANVRPNWSAKKYGLVEFLGELKLAQGQLLNIVDEDAPHVINLLDPVEV